MRVLMFDIDTLRSDHLGCYGYGRNTSPTIDSIAEEGVRFADYYCPNAPCLPSRASLITGQYGIRTGVVGHGGTAADMRLQGETRHFTDDYSENGLFMQFRRAGMHTVSFSTFAERHSSWWFNCGFNELYNVGKRGSESAEDVTPHVLDWIERNGEKDNWFMHVHFWDPHTPYRAPASFGNPFADEPLPDNWIDDKIFAEHLMHIGPHGANEINMWNDDTNAAWPRHPGRLETVADMKNFIDNYDCGVRFTDDNIKMILDLLIEDGLCTAPNPDYCPVLDLPKPFLKQTENIQKKWYEQDHRYGNLVCRCEGITEGDILRVLREPLPPKNMNGLKKRLRTTMGRCQGSFCTPRILEILSREWSVPPEKIMKEAPGSPFVKGRVK